MGRHSRRGPAPKPAGADTAARESRSGLLGRRRAAGPPAGEQTSPPVSGAPGTASHGAPGGPRGGDVGRQGHTGPGPGPGSRWRPEEAAPAHGFPSVPGGAPGRDFPRDADGTPAHGFPRAADGTPAHGFPRVAGGTSERGLPDGADGTPARGVPRFPDGTPAHGVPRVRGGHPQQREPGGGWGELSGPDGAGTGDGTPTAPPGGARTRPGPPGGPAGPGTPFPRQRQGSPGGPRQEYLDAFDGDGGGDVFAPRPRRRVPAPAQPADPYASVTDWSADDGPGGPGPDAAARADAPADDAPPTGEPATAKGAKGRTFTGIAAAAVTTVLAVVVAGQVADGSDGEGARSQSATDQARGAHDSASRDEGRPTPSAPESAKPLTYEQKMGKTYPLDATLKGSGEFEAIAGIAEGPEKGDRHTYRVDVERGLGLDGELFAEAIHKTLNDDRSWAHNGAHTFTRIYSGEPEFVITLASPGTTAEWCAKSGLDTTVDNVSCDSAATQRVMVNAYRWAQGAEPYGDDIHGYRQMLINHEVGHRIGYNHVTCDKDGELAPVMQQQTKFVDHDGIDCRPNPWAYPNS
ncbi:DUF3152 domain-containing protein [Streptomyces sp. M92]|uniref:DUF3152 domain-containing protein n=1 Tax=Streptomyces sp. M92 TaxID=2944250 RepID=UPI002349D666|nr:DUF3152 domain-containing protein [Streptomyces sp. M92]WCN03113.1 DUF3152 domain-containing protein [Streptomyces sp. M92]